MKTISEIKDEVAKQEGYKSWVDYDCDEANFISDKCVDEIAKRYAEEALIEASNRFLYQAGIREYVKQEDILNIIKELK